MFKTEDPRHLRLLENLIMCPLVKHLSILINIANSNLKNFKVCYRVSISNTGKLTRKFGTLSSELWFWYEEKYQADVHQWNIVALCTGRVQVSWKMQ